MTYYYYLAADIPLQEGYYYDDRFRLDFDRLLPFDNVLTFEKSEERIQGFDHPIQLEIYNGVTEEKEAEKLWQYIQKQMDSYKVCTIQMANLINSNRVKFKIDIKSKLLLHQLEHPEQLILPAGHLLTIKKVPVFY